MKPDLKQETLRAEMYAAQLRVDILAHGLAHALSTLEPFRFTDNGALDVVSDLFNGEFMEAVATARRAAKAYEPYWRGRRRRVSIFRRPKKKAEKKK